MAAPNVPTLAGRDDDDNAPNNPHFVAPLSQARYFYTYRWTRQCDKAYSRHGHCQIGRTPNMHSLEFARHFVKYVADWDFKYKVLKYRLNRLRLRYNTFRCILETPGFNWEPEENVVNASIEDWRLLFTEVDFGRVYFYAGDPDWNEFLIFEPEEEDPHPIRIYNISSDEETIDDDDDDDMDGIDDDSNGIGGSGHGSGEEDAGMNDSGDEDGSGDSSSTVSNRP